MLLPGAFAVTGVWVAYVSAGSIDWRLQHWSAWLWVGTIVDLAVAMHCPALVGRRGVPRFLSAQTFERTALAAALAAALAMPCRLGAERRARPPQCRGAVGRPVRSRAPGGLGIRVSLPGLDAPQRRRNKLIGFLLAHHANERFILAAPNALQAAPIIVATGKPVMATGGYLGRDPILTSAELQGLTARGEVRFILTGGPSLVRADDRQQAIAHWVRSNGTVVDRSLWLPARAAPSGHAGSSRFVQEPAELFDMQPQRRAASN